MSAVNKMIQLIGAMLVTLVTNWSLLALRVLQGVAAPRDLAEHHGFPLFVIRAEVVVRLRVADGALPVVPAGRTKCRIHFERIFLQQKGTPLVKASMKSVCHISVFFL